MSIIKLGVSDGFFVLKQKKHSWDERYINQKKKEFEGNEQCSAKYTEGKIMW